ncbi:transmembrane protein 53 isoform X2 [Betta splendens]|uniref:Transmembrane protein 53 isoform X2 n=1 Tax=Betta splendens TaxID=158456 RepID=A0A6P7KY06_BETSP|nr:transmembrane protein 53 isoform X2 [Betta splendens]
MADTEMDYNIVFPDAGTSERHWRGTKEPVVVLLGWAGCKDKHLSKYSSIYNERGCVTIRYTAPLKTVFISESFGYKELSSTARKLLEILYDYEVENSPIFFHVFSNGGFMLYRYVVELLYSDRHFSPLCVIGAVLDSAPGGGNVRGALRALTATLGPNVSPVLRYFLLGLFAVTVFLLRIVLYPVTKADQVIRHADVTLFMEALRLKGTPVDSCDFVSSAHVSHLRAFPEQYTQKCSDFLINCMKDVAEMKKRHRIQNQ